MKAIILTLLLTHLVGCSTAWKQERLTQNFNDPTKSVARNFMDMTDFKYFNMYDTEIPKQLASDHKHSNAQLGYTLVGATNDMTNLASMASGAAVFGGLALLMPEPTGPAKNEHLFLIMPSDVVTSEDAERDLFEHYTSYLFDTLKSNMSLIEHSMYKTSNASLEDTDKSYVKAVHGLPRFELPKYDNVPESFYCFDGCDISIYPVRFEYMGPYTTEQFPEQIALEKNLLPGKHYYIGRTNGIFSRHPVLQSVSLMKYAPNDFIWYSSIYNPITRDKDSSKGIPALITQNKAFPFLTPKKETLRSGTNYVKN